MAHRAIPTRFTTDGNRAAAEQLEGLGEKVLSKLEHDMSFSPGRKTGRKTITLADGTTIRAGVSFGTTTIHIDVPEVVAVPSVGGECLCGKYFSEGVVVGVHPVAGYVDAAQLYTVDVCQVNNTQITVTGCVAQDWHVHAEEDHVWCCLTVREVIATRPYTYADDVTEFLFSACYGCMGTEKGYTTVAGSSAVTDYADYEGVRFVIAGFITEAAYYANEELGSGNIAPIQEDLHKPINHGWGCGFPRYYYENVAQLAFVPANATYANWVAITDPDDWWLGKYPSMCSLSEVITSEFWLCEDHDTTGLLPMVKQAKWLYCEYAMLETKQSGSGGVPPVFEEDIDGDTDPDAPIKKYAFNLQIIPKQ